ALDGALHGGQFLYGNTYVVLPETPVPFALDALRDRTGAWSLPSIRWRDGEVLAARGSAAFGSDASLRDLDVELHSRDLSGLATHYLSGWLAIAGLPGLSASGALEARVRLND